METNKPHKESFKLENFSKKGSFSVPDGYFDKLPTIIQAKAIESTKKAFVFNTGMALKFALPSVVLLMLVGYFGYKYQNGTTNTDANIELMLADISTEEMVQYLDQTDLSSEDLLELVSFEGEQIDDFAIELENISEEELEFLIDDFNLEGIENI
ncbi:MAG: hypothetical protein L3J29_01570 [Cyclobacteriaceae bacterium]|nr:hypothetical protein [Cyclobacteriaceae bacterium]